MKIPVKMNRFITYLLIFVWFCCINYVQKRSMRCNAQPVVCCSDCPTFELEQCSANIITNHSFDNCKNVNRIRIPCAYRPGEILHIEAGAFDKVKRSLKTLIIKHFTIEYLPGRIFCGFDKLAAIVLFDNGIKDIYNTGLGNECNDQSDGSYLVHLNLGNNEIKILRTNTFSHLKNLKTLYISRNRLEQIEEGAFNGLSKLIKLDLSNNYLTVLPTNIFENLAKITHLSLSANLLTSQGLPSFKYFVEFLRLRLDSNFLKEINGDILDVKTLRKLNISNNPLEITENSFRLFPYLRELIISNANLSDLDSEVFINLTSLGKLTLSYNNLTTFPKETIRNTVGHLYLNGNNMRSIPDLRAPKLHGVTFFSLSRNQISNLSNICILLPSRSLVFLDLSINVIEKITKNTFDCYNNLRDLNLSQNSLKIIESPNYVSPNSLRTLHLDHNQLTILESTMIKCPKCSIITASHNNIISISYDDISFSVKTFNVSHNAITNEGITNSRKNVNYIASSGINPAALVVDISFNKLTYLRRYDFPPQTTSIYANNNSIESFQRTFFQSTMARQIKFIYLHNNQLQYFTLKDDPSSPIAITLKGNPFICSCEIEWFRRAATGPFLVIKDLQYVQCINPFPKIATGYHYISTLDRAEDFLCKSTYSHPKYCKRDEKLLSSSECYFQCPALCSCYHNRNGSLAIFECSEKNMTLIPIINSTASSLYLYLDGNFLTSLNESSFGYNRGIEKLSFNGNQLKYIHSHTFKHLQKLQVLILKDNCLTNIHQELFENLTHLRQLDLSHNNLIRLSVQTLLPVKNLNILKLNHNFLHNFSFWDLSDMKDVQLISIHNNPWSCECEFVKTFRSWLTENSKLIDNTDDIFCKTESGLFHNMISYNFSDCYDKEISLLETTTSIWASVLAVTCFLTLMGGLLFYYRREMQVLIYSRYGVRLFHRNDDSDTDDNKIFDVFISYNSDDEEFVVHELLPGLENIDKPYKTCIHHRDFLAGGFITENIMEAVAKSRRTIIVLTENFVKSEWCRFEFKVAHVKMLEDQKIRVIVIVINEVPNNVDKELHLYLKTNTYLKWEDRLFWKRLYFLLPDRR